jgi:cellulose synthase/poly-beta-1,6-N-acetylglucosamine synthase-like glycosyltransferase
MTTALVITALVIGLPGLATALHLGLLALASLFYRDEDSRTIKQFRLLVLIPAHNEELVIGRCLQAIEDDRRERDSVLVVADRCTDGTTEIARSFGATVLERGSGEEPGRAAARQAGLDVARRMAWDAVVMLDADSVIEPGFFDACETALASGAAAVQARSESRGGQGLGAEASLAAFALQGITIPRGRARLGLSVRLRGTGMAIRRDVVLAHHFHAPASEDLVFTLDLLLAGTRCAHVESARLHSDGTPDWESFGGQKVRYEAGRLSAARAYVGPLLSRAVRKRDSACFEAAWFLATLPFAMAVLSTAAAATLAAVAGASSVAAVMGAALATLVLVLVIGLVQAGARLRTWLVLLAAPWYIAWKAAVQLRALASVLRNRDYYPPTARA